MAFAKSQLGANVRLPSSGTAFVSVKDAHKEPVLAPGARSSSHSGSGSSPRGAPRGYFNANGIPCTDTINKVLEGRPHIVDAMKNAEVQLVFNTTEGATRHRRFASDIRRTALMYHIPYYTTLAGVVTAVTEAISRRLDYRSGASVTAAAGFCRDGPSCGLPYACTTTQLTPGPPRAGRDLLSCRGAWCNCLALTLERRPALNRVHSPYEETKGLRDGGMHHQFHAVDAATWPRMTSGALRQCPRPTCCSGGTRGLMTELKRWPLKKCQ